MKRPFAQTELGVGAANQSGEGKIKQAAAETTNCVETSPEVDMD